MSNMDSLLKVEVKRGPSSGYGEKKDAFSKLSNHDVIPIARIAEQPHDHALRRHTTSEHAVAFIFTHHAVRCIWCLIVMVQLLNGIQLISLSFIYVSYAAEDMSVLQYLAISFLQAPQQAYLVQNGLWIGIVYATLGSVFLLSTSSMLMGTLWTRQLSLGGFVSQLLTRTLSQVARWIGFHKPRCWSSATRETSQGPSQPLRVESAFTHAYWRFQVWWVACGVRGEYFEQTLLIREAIELVYQAIQANQVSRKISHKYINYAYTMLIAVNALLHPVLDRLYADNPPMKRFAVVFADFFLDFVWGCLLPVWMFWPLLQLDTSKSAEELLFVRGFGSIENTQREVEQIVILSWSALLLSVFPFLSAMLSLRSVKKLLKVAKRINSWSEVTPEERARSFNISVSPHQLAPANGAPNDKLVKSLVLARCHSFLSCCGVVIAIVAIVSSGLFIKQPASSFRVWTEACKYPLTPWFATRQACAVWYLNCSQMAIQGNADELRRALRLVDAASVVYLSFDSCDLVELPETISQFTNLRALALWSSKLESWGDESAISTGNLPSLQTVLLKKTTITDDSERIRGFVTGTWPARVEKAIFVDTDLSVLNIPDTATTWELLHGWYCVRCGLVGFPGALYHGAHLRELTIQQTALFSIPPPRIECPLWPQLKILDLGNDHSLTYLADEIWELLTSGSLLQLRIGGTNISFIPPQLVSKLPSSPAIFAANSTLCRDRDLRLRAPALVCEDAA